MSNELNRQPGIPVKRSLSPSFGKNRSSHFSPARDPGHKRGGTGWDVLSLLGALLLLGFFVAVITPSGYRGARAQAREKSCYANIRVLVGAVEMFNMDASGTPQMKTLDAPLLLSQRYLKVEPKCPGGTAPSPFESVPFFGRFIRDANVPGGIYYGSDLTGSGTIGCSLHGTIE